MNLRKRNIFKTFVLSKSIAGLFLYIISTFLVLSIGLFLARIMPKEGFSKKMLDSFFSSERLYQGVCEIFTDDKGRVGAIMGGYTMSLVKESVNIKNSQIQDNDMPKKTEENPKITESTATSFAKIKNQTSKIIDENLLLSEKLEFEANNQKPKVLIIHTHTTESYYEQDRSIDEEKNMIAVGSVIESALTAAGIAVIHDKTVHDYPSYNGSYTRSFATASKNLSNNSDINIILDVHRDAVATEDGSKLSLTTEIEGVKTAQLMFVVGTDEQLSHPYWRENLKLALKLQKEADSLYQGLMRPINLRSQRFNQQISKGSIILEVGTNGNRLEEAKQGAKLFSDVLIKVLSNYN